MRLLKADHGKRLEQLGRTEKDRKLKDTWLYFEMKNANTC